MGAKCFRPQSSMFPVYISQLNKIYQQAMQAHHNYQKLEGNRNIDLIANIEAQLKQEGSLKKLIDHLSSHKSKIYDTLQHCLVLVSSSQNYILHVTTGIILKKIVELLRSFRTDQSLNTVMTQKSKDMQLQNQPTTNQRFVKNRNNKLIRVNLSSQVEQSKNSEIVFFKLIDLLLQKDRQPNLIAYISKILADFSVIKGTMYLDTKTISSILQKLVHLLKIIPKSIATIKNSILQAYLFTLQNFKFNTINETFAKRHIRFFLHQWSNDVESKPYKLQVLANELHHSHERELIEGIIRSFLQNSIGSIEWEYVLEEVLFLYDHYSFSQKIIPIEEVLFNSASSYALRQQFRHRNFDYFINYLSVVKEAEQSVVIQSESSYFEDMKAKYVFILKQQNKINCIKTLMRWTHNFKQETLETLKYKKYHLFQALFVNLSTKNSELYKEIVDSLGFFTQVYAENYQTVLQMVISSINHINANQTFLFNRILNIASHISSKDPKIQSFHLQALFSPLKSKNLDKSWFLIDLILCFIGKVDFYSENFPIQTLCRFLNSIISINSIVEAGNFYQMQVRFIKHCEAFYKAIIKYIEVVQAYKEAIIIRLNKSIKQLPFRNLLVFQRCTNQDSHHYVEFIKKYQIDILKIKKGKKDSRTDQLQYQKQIQELFKQFNYERVNFVKLSQIGNIGIYKKASLILQNEQQMIPEFQHKQSIDWHNSRSLMAINQQNNNLSVSESTFINVLEMIKIV